MLSLPQWIDQTRALPPRTRLYVDRDVFEHLAAEVKKQYRWRPWNPEPIEVVRIRTVTVRPRDARRG